ncbi:MAG: hypothetical protein H7Y12_01890 [Sphingobacteriaceae bacterium]|nr:hypothetical protein [Cytophagaceae bacterium]
MISTEESLLEHCRRLIETQLGWGSARMWSHADFVALSEKIFGSTGVQLSHTTLKRIWGRVRYESAPTLATLNALAQFAGYENWRAFQQKSADAQPLDQEDAVFLSPTLPPTRTSTHWWMASAGILLLVLALLWAFRRQPQRLRYGAVTFTSQPVAVGIPNTVLFRYDARDSNADSVFIQQSWDPRRRFRVDKQRHEYASTYYYPGYFRAKLVLNDSVVREHDLYLRSEGWLATLDREPILAGPIPVYFRKPQRPDGTVGLGEADLRNQRVDTTKEIPWTSLFNVQDLGGVSGDDFTFETRLRSTFGRGDAVCQQAYIVLQCSNGHHVVPLSISGCVGELALTFGDAHAEGKTSDFSGFGVPSAEWVTVRCEVHRKAVRVFVNERLAWQGRFEKNVGKLVGLRYRFHGTGEVASAEFRRADGSGVRRLL